jgi:hypothetical protein
MSSWHRQCAQGIESQHFVLLLHLHRVQPGQLGVRVAGTVEGGSAAASGAITEGMQLMSVYGEDCRNLSFDEVKTLVVVAQYASCVVSSLCSALMHLLCTLICAICKALLYALSGKVLVLLRFPHIVFYKSSQN